MGKRQHHKHIFDNPHRKAIKSGEKNKKVVKWYIDLLKKEEKYGETKWIRKTKEKAKVRLEKYGISVDSVKQQMNAK